MSNFRPFFDFSQICRKFCMWTAIRLKNIVQFFFWPICVSYSRNNVCKELCFSLRGDNYSFHASDLQITLRLLSSSLRNTVLLHTLFLEYETQIGQKKNWTMFFNRIAVHMQNFWQIWEKSKNGLKFDIRRFCIQPFKSSLMTALAWKLVCSTQVTDKPTVRSVHLFSFCLKSLKEARHAWLFDW